MPLQETSGAASYDAFGGGVAAVPNYIEDVFSTYLYTGNGSTQTITNGIDLAGQGGVVWIKCRSAAYDNIVFDTARTTNPRALYTNLTNAAGYESFNQTSTGFTVYGQGPTGQATQTYASWTFRKAPKFFDVVTYTGTGTSRAIPHSLGSVPGCYIIKRLNAANDWAVYHRATSATPWNDVGFLNLTDAWYVGSGAGFFGAAPTSTTFQVNTNLNNIGDTYVAYLFAHNAGGFGLTGTDNVISCGSVTDVASGTVSVNLGYEPQFILYKPSNAVGNWFIQDNMRGMPTYTGTGGVYLAANSSAAEAGAGNLGITSTGFDFGAGGTNTWIYIAIRRGPMKTPTSGTSVFTPIVNSNSTGATNTTGFPVDLQLWNLTGGYQTTAQDRLRGVSTTSTQTSCPELVVPYTYAESSNAFQVRNWNNTGFETPSGVSGSRTIWWNFRRAPGFFDEVCYTGDGTTNRNLNHNLTVAPELLICKRRSGVLNWHVLLPSGNVRLFLNSTSASPTYSGAWSGTTPTATTFSLGGDADLNASGSTYVTYLFATVAGVSKVGSYTGNGTSQTINCGFTSGARFLLIKATSTSGDWYVWDTARGITSSYDPFLRLNLTNAEIGYYNVIVPNSTGFGVQNDPEGQGNPVNTAGVSYLYLAIA